MDNHVDNGKSGVVGVGGAQRFYPVRDADKPSKVFLEPISEEVYRALYPEIWRIRSKAQAHGQCMCPRRYLWKCDADCELCQYHAAGDRISLDYIEEESGNPPMDNLFPEPDSLAVDQILLQQLLCRLDELMPEARSIGELRLEGMADRQIAETIGIAKSTFRSRVERAKAQLKEEFGLDFAL